VDSESDRICIQYSWDSALWDIEREVHPQRIPSRREVVSAIGIHHIRSIQAPTILYHPHLIAPLSRSERLSTVAARKHVAPDPAPLREWFPHAICELAIEEPLYYE